MRRRQFIGAAAATVAAGLAGCTGFFSDSPDEVVEQFFNALNDGDRETANELIHSDSPQGEITEDEISQYEEAEITVESTELVDESDDRATVKAEVTIEYEGDSTTDESEYKLRKEGGDWKLYE